jgi:glycosyltransferase involved in cell wall biosynthesis
MPERKELLGRLLDRLAPQVEKYPLVETFIKTSSPDRSVGDQRQEMLDKASGEYVCFVDDDDIVSPKYVETIYPLLDGVDYIGFPVHTFRDGVFFCAAYHSLKHKNWMSDKLYAQRDISHLNPIRRELALQAPMEGGYGEDGRWSMRIRDLGIVKTEHYIPDVMYYYYIRTHKPEFGPKLVTV